LTEEITENIQLAFTGQDPELELKLDDEKLT
jgi:hypothetical protein